MPFGGWVLSLEKFNAARNPSRATPSPAPACCCATCTPPPLASGQFYPPDPTETGSSIGGNIACNASGSRSFRYGATGALGGAPARRARRRPHPRFRPRRAHRFRPRHDPAARRHQEHRRLSAAPGHGLGRPVHRLRRHAGRRHRSHAAAAARAQGGAGGRDLLPERRRRARRRRGLARPAPPACSSISTRLRSTCCAQRFPEIPTQAPRRHPLRAGTRVRGRSRSRRLAGAPRRHRRAGRRLLVRHHAPPIASASASFRHALPELVNDTVRRSRRHEDGHRFRRAAGPQSRDAGVLPPAAWKPNSPAAT